jgi:uncharacterized protein YcbK (DUF882 family)
MPSHHADTPSVRARRRSSVGAVIAGALAIGLVVLGGFGAYHRFLREDSGIAACKAVRDDRKTSMDSDGNGEFTEEEYKAVREMFSDSRYEDIREHGKSLVDLIWQVNRIRDDEAAGDLIGRIANHATGLQTACADRGVVVNLMDN